MANDFDPRNIRVALLAGGRSGEREISLASGAGTCKALEEAGFSVTMLDPACKDDLKKLIDEEFDVAFLCLHGKYGEDGTIQGFLEILDLPYTGSSVWSSSLAIDKVKSKVFYEYAGIPTPQSCMFSHIDDIDYDDVEKIVGAKCVVKPATEGSSLGLRIVDTREDFFAAAEAALAIDKEILIERYVEGIELTVAVIGNDDLSSLPIIEIVPQNEFYDFDSKYAPGGSQHICPARLNDEQTALVQNYAIMAHQALSCSGVSRSDFILDPDGNVWILETNTLPGMTGTSLLPDAARVAGIEFPDLCTMLVRLALDRA